MIIHVKPLNFIYYIKLYLGITKINFNLKKKKRKNKILNEKNVINKI